MKVILTTKSHLKTQREGKEMVFCMWIFWGVSFLWVISKQEGWQETRQHSSAEVSKSGKLLASGRTSNDDAGRFLVACEKGGAESG